MEAIFGKYLIKYYLMKFKFQKSYIMSSKVKMLSKKVASVVKKTKVKCLKNTLRHVEEFLGEFFQDLVENR